MKKVIQITLIGLILLLFISILGTMKAGKEYKAASWYEIGHVSDYDKAIFVIDSDVEIHHVWDVKDSDTYYQVFYNDKPTTIKMTDKAGAKIAINALQLEYNNIPEDKREFILFAYEE